MYVAVVDCLQSLLWARIFLGTCLDIWGYFWLNPHVVYVSWRYDEFPHQHFVIWQVISLLTDAIFWGLGVVQTNAGISLVRGSGRLIVALGLLWGNPTLQANFLIIYAVLLLIWSWSDALRYANYTARELQLRVRWLEWNSQFIILIPVAMLCQSFLASVALHELTGSLTWILLFVVVLLYGCGYTILFLHMWERRDRLEERKKYEREREKGPLGVV